jgi:methenyltetrahydromethanopterin cyclohydrolase
MQYQASVNKLTQPLVQHLLDQADKLRLGIEKLENGCTVIDAGIKVPGGLEAGRIITEICMGGMGTVDHYAKQLIRNNWPLTVSTCMPPTRFYPVWVANTRAGVCRTANIMRWVPGPARAMATKTKEGVVEPVEELVQRTRLSGYCDENRVGHRKRCACRRLKSLKKWRQPVVLQPASLTIIVTPTSSLAGGVQVVGAVLEVAMHKAHALHFPLENIVDGSGSAPICPPHPNFVKAMGRTNDAILFAGQVHLFVKGSDEAAEKLAKELPSSTSKDYGKAVCRYFQGV